MIVCLGNNVFVNPEHVVSVTRTFHENGLIVVDILGNRHEVQRQYGETIYEAEKRGLALLNK